MDRLRDLPSWPHAAHSRFARHRPHDWHIQEIGSGPTILFLHGAGASTHTWRDVIPVLAPRYRCIALDLPGQGFTAAGTLRRCSLETMTEDIANLCVAEDWRPVALVGHSAGAAIAINLAERLPQRPAVIGINAALGRFRGIASWLFPFLAKLLALNPLTAILFARGSGNAARARRLIEGTGSKIDEVGLACYAKLMGDVRHVNATLQMMTQWNVDKLVSRLPNVGASTLLLTGSGDRAVPPDTSDIAASRMAHAKVERMRGLGHLAHEEVPKNIARRIAAFLNSHDESTHEGDLTCHSQ